MSGTRLGRWRDDTGATSVVFAVVAVLILAVAALAVDLTNLYAQRAVAQGRADTAAFAAAQALPDACAAVTAARRSLQDTGGPRAGAEPEPAVTVYGPDPPDEDGDPTTPAPPPAPVTSVGPGCSPTAASVQVRTAPRTVPFAFAGVLDLFQDGSGVSRTTVSAVTRVALAEPDLLPLVLPQDCLGDVLVLAAPAPEPDPAPAEPAPEDPAPADPAPEDPPVGTPVETPAPAGSSTEVAPGTAGSPDAPRVQPAPVRLAVPAPSPGCLDPEAGRGVLDSPRLSGETVGTALRQNLREGIDHPVQAHPVQADPGPSCRLGASGAVRDVAGADGTPTCVRTVPVGDVTPVLAELQDRFAAAPAGCGPVTGGAWATLEDCYLRPGADRDDVLTPGPEGSPGRPGLDEAVLADPRFFVVAEVGAGGYEEDAGAFVPVLRLRGAFATADGLDPGTAPGTLQAFVFPLEALPALVVDVDAGRPRTLVLTRPVVATATEVDR